MVDFNLLSEGKADTLNTVESHMNVQTEGETGRQQEEVSNSGCSETLK